MVDEYLERLKEIEKKATFKKTRRIYENIINTNDSLETLYAEANRALQYPLEPNKVQIGAIARKLMLSNNIEYVFHGALLYEKIGKANRLVVKDKLLKSLEKNPNKRYIKKITGFLERNSSEKQSGLEGKTLTTIFSGASILIALFFLSPNLTGNVIGALNSGNSSIFGIILFVLGLLGLFISLKY